MLRIRPARQMPALFSTDRFPGRRTFRPSLASRVGTPIAFSPSAIFSVLIRYHFARSNRRISWALTATITVLSDMNSAPSAGESRIPHGARTPAARGSATML